jgi:hypothetical protein
MLRSVTLPRKGMSGESKGSFGAADPLFAALGPTRASCRVRSSGAADGQSDPTQSQTYETHYRKASVLAASSSCEVSGREIRAEGRMSQLFQRCFKQEEEAFCTAGEFNGLPSSRSTSTPLCAMARLSTPRECMLLLERSSVVRDSLRATTCRTR